MYRMDWGTRGTPCLNPGREPHVAALRRVHRRASMGWQAKRTSRRLSARLCRKWSSAVASPPPRKSSTVPSSPFADSPPFTVLPALLLLFLPGGREACVALKAARLGQSHTVSLNLWASSDFGCTPKLVKGKKMDICADAGWARLNDLDICTSHCGKPPIRFFGYEAPAADGFGIGYHAMPDAVHFCITHFDKEQAAVFKAALQARLTDLKALFS